MMPDFNTCRMMLGQPNPDPGYMVLDFVRDEEGWDEAEFDKEWAEHFAYTVNADSFYGFGPGTVLGVEIETQPVEAEGVSYFVVTYRFRVCENGWQLEYPEREFAELELGITG